MVPRAEFTFPAKFEGSLPFHRTSGVTPGKTRGVVIFEVIAPRVTKVTIVQQVDFGGSVPPALANKVAVYTLGTVEDLRAKYERMDERMEDLVDCETRRQFVLTLRAKPPASNHARDQVVSTSVQLKKDYAASKVMAQLLLPTQSERHMVTMEVKVPLRKMGEQSTATGKASTILDCSRRVAAAYIMAFCSFVRLRLSKEEGNRARSTRPTAPSKPCLGRFTNESLCRG